MKIIPINLKDLKFCRIYKNSKGPFEKNWPNTPYTYNEISKFFPEENYGVLTGYEGLSVIDSDNIVLKEVIEEKLPKTFTVETGGGGTHYYYIIHDLKEKIILETEDGLHLGEIQNKGQQVVGPRSIHPNGNSYVVLNDIPLTEITYEQLKSAIELFMQKNKNIQKKLLKYDTEYMSIDNLNVVDVWDITKLTKRGEEHMGAHPIHGSDTGVNFWVNIKKNIWHCFRCNSGGGPLSGIAVKEGIIECKDAQEGILKGEKAEEIFKISREKYGLTKEAEERIKYAISVIIELEKELKNISERDLRRKIDMYLNTISEIENWADIQYLLGIISMKIKISRINLGKRIDAIKENNIKTTHLFSALDIINMELPEISFYIENLIPKNSLIMLQGKPGQFKSMLALLLCVYMKSKVKFLDKFEIQENPRILYYDQENELLEIKKRLMYCINGLNKQPEEVLNSGFHIEKRFMKINKKQEIEKCKNYDVIILDSLRRFIDGDESKSEVTNKFYIEFVKELVDMGKTVIIIVHDKKGDYENQTYEGGRMEMMRGSGDIGAQADLVLALTKDFEAKKIGSKTSIIDLYLSVEKNRKGLDLEKSYNFRVEKDDEQKSTVLKFIREGHPPRPSEKLRHRIVEFIKERKEVKLTEILEYIKKSTNYSESSIKHKLQELVKEGEISQPKQGNYSADKQISL